MGHVTSTLELFNLIKLHGHCSNFSGSKCKWQKHNKLRFGLPKSRKDHTFFNYM